MKHVIVGTAGHIDHGKSALVQALTGTDPDRLEEEKRRGITIDIGFATLELPSDASAQEGLDRGYRLGFVDVPGHERFVKNMLAGISGIDLVLFVVAADESVQPQSARLVDWKRPGSVSIMPLASSEDSKPVPTPARFSAVRWPAKAVPTVWLCT